MSDQRIPVGVVVRAHGIRGDVLVAPLTDNPGRFARGAQFLLDRAPGTVTVIEVRPHKEGLLIRFAEILDRTAAETLAKATLTIAAAERRALDPGEYWPEDLVGLTAVGPDDRVLGEVTDVILGAAQDRLVVTTPGGRPVEVPFVAALVGEPAGATISMSPPDGLFDESAQVQRDT
jgi:16S rRNA processing protein RimM